MSYRCSLCARAALIVTAMVIFLSSITLPTFAETTKLDVSGKYYEFPEKSNYEISSSESVATSAANTYGKFTLNGNVKSDGNKNGVPAYKVEEGALEFVYSYTDKLPHDNLDEWHLVDDNSKKIDGSQLNENIRKGAMWLQTSMDKINWNEAVCVTDAFNAVPNNSEAFYKATDIELINGCYYKMIIAYETRIRTEESNFLFVDTDKFDLKKHAEVYEFYAYTDSGEKAVIDYNQTYNIGERVRAKEFDGYYGKDEIKKDDIHYGWNLGNFFVSGYTDKRVDNGEVVFLKNVGDMVTLWFNLQQNIDKLNGKDNLSITADNAGFDRYFETPKTDFGKGTLIVRYTDYNNNKSEPQIYTNYLEANTSFGADTKVQLFEEGDYEVALDYQVTEDNLIDNVGHYRIFFKFSVRNGNCMVYPFDLKTGSELNNSSMTENGFRLDLANSRYLQINLKREVMKDSADGLVEDTRFNGPAKDGATYTDEGIYTITASNQYTGQFTVKKIYVGTNNVLRAYMTTGLTIPEINNLVANGATINEDGTIQLAEKVEPVPPESVTSEETSTIAPSEENIEVIVPVDDTPEENKLFPVVIIAAVAGVVVIGLVAVLIVIKKKSQNKIDKTDDNEGGDDK